MELRVFEMKKSHATVLKPSDEYRGSARNSYKKHCQGFIGPSTRQDNADPDVVKQRQ